MKKIFLLLIFTEFACLTLTAQFKKERDRTFDISKSGISGNLNISNEHTESRIPELLIKYNSIPYSITAGEIRPVAFDNEGKPIAFEGKLPEGKRSNKDALVQSKDFLNSVKEFIAMKDPNSEIIKKDEIVEADGIKHVKLNQTYKNIPLFGREIWAHYDRNGIYLMNGSWTKTPEIEDIIPAFDEKEAYKIVKEKEKFAPKVFLPAFLKTNSSTELVIYDLDGQNARLAYHIIAYPDGLHRWEYFIDAKTGEIFEKIENTCKFHHADISVKSENKVDAQNETVTNCYDLTGIKETDLANPIMDPLNKHVVMQGADLLGVTRQVNSLESGTRRYMIDVNREMFKAASALPNDPDGVLWTIDAFNGSPENDNFRYDHVSTPNISWNNPAAVSSQYNMALSYEYFRNVHGRNAINGQGGNVISLINVAEKDGTSMGNAFWNGAAMFYGNGDAGLFPLARGLDVAGHEMSHGVVQSTANLVYQGESGALNESFADIFGAMIDRDDWLIGEDVVKKTAFLSGALRSMQDPHNGAQKDDYGAGFQPKLYSERYRGTQDEGGVHINSGIPNFAFFLFASNPAVGKDRAEKVFYRALSTYLTKSSQFIDARFATAKAAQDLYGDNVSKIMNDVWTSVGVGTSNQVVEDPKDKYQQTIPVNPGQDLILFSSGTKQNLFIMNDQQELIFNPLSNISPISRPSVTDDGRQILVVDKDKKAKLITVNYTQRTKTEQVLLASNNFRNAVISKNGTLFAFLLDEPEPYIYIFDASKNPAQQKFVRLRNPTTSTQGKSTDDVEYADAMEFDHSGEYLMYDALNKIKSPTAGEISYWDINFVRVFDNGGKRLLDTTQQMFSKLFSQLPDGVSVGNPTFSKNSPHIIAFDYLDEKKKEYKIYGANIETGKVDLIANNTDLGVPTFSKKDDIVLFNTPSFFSGSNISGVALDASKIKSPNPTPSQVRTNASLAVWYANGARQLTDIDENISAENAIQIYPNPASQQLLFKSSVSDKFSEGFSVEIFDQVGKKWLKESYDGSLSNVVIDVSSLLPGLYQVKINGINFIQVSKFLKL